MALDGSNQKTFYKKYDVVLYHLMIYLMCTQLTTRPMFITLKRIEEHPLFYSSRGLHNGDTIIPLQPIHHIAIMNIIDEHPQRIYLFTPSLVQPFELSSKDKICINNHFNRLLRQYNPDLSVSMYKNKKYGTNMLSLMIREKAKLHAGHVELDI
jgi:hypothetical protein